MFRNYGIKLIENPVNLNAKFTKDQKKANYSNKIIAFGTNSTGKYRDAYGLNANTKNYNSDDIVMISVNGNNRPNQLENVKKTKDEIDLAILQGVNIFIKDNLKNSFSSHNSKGEGEIHNFLISKGFKLIEIEDIGIYKK